MATRKFGKLKINTDDGLAFRFGDGKVHRFGRHKDDQPEYDDDQYENGYPEDEDRGAGYDDDYEDEDRGDEYEDDYGDDDRGYGEDYSDDGYEDEDDGRSDRRNAGRFDDRYGDDEDRGYDDGYSDDYDDRYSDEDADDYGDDNYASENPVMRFLELNDWPTYVLLLLLPPVGIWLLWHRRRFEKPIRYAVSAASAVWFIVVLVILLSGVLSGSGDTTVTGNITVTTPAPTATASATQAPASDDSVLGDLTGDWHSTDDPDSTADPESTDSSMADQLAPDTTPTATALASANGAIAADSVYMTQTGAYYHNNPSCEELTAEGNSVSTVTTDVAIERGKSPCPVCYPDQTLYYATESGKYYHKDATCSGMKDATTITEEAAKAAGKTACPVCITGDLTGLGTLKFINSDTKDKSGITVYATKSGKYFHTESTCSGMTGAVSGSLCKALLAGKEPCPKCAKSASTGVYCTKDGKYYHNKSDCSGMVDAYKISLAEALVMGKKRCSVCWGNSTGGYFTSNASSDDSSTTTLSTTNGKVYVYATQGGTYYHTNSTCSGMTGASRVELKKAIEAGKKPCPTCCSGADHAAYVTSKGTYYHSTATCSGMSGAKETTVAEALADGYKKCPNCWGGSSGSGASTTVYATKNGTYYHTKSNCSGMTGATAMSLSDAVKAGKTACPTCASAAKRTVYSTDSGTYYHSNKTCGGMSGAKARTLQEALLKGQTACPTCIGTSTGSKITGTGTFSKGKTITALNGTSATVTNVSSSKLKNVTSSTFSTEKAKAAAMKAVASGSVSSLVSSSIKTGTSGIYVYATASGKYYHTIKSHAGSGATRVTLETAIKYGKTECPTCSSTAGRTVYASSGSKYYHYYKAHAGSGAVSGKLSYALALGLEPCPTCVKYAQAKLSGTTVTNNYTAGTSGVKVYATITGKYYHVSKTCAGDSAAHISLETALNYGKTACPTCTSLAKKKVYASMTDKYYHSSKTHAGSDAFSVTLASAMAAGKKACPVCITGSEAYEISDIEYSASGDTSVYVDVDGDLAYYHRTASCSDAGMSNGTKVDLEFVIKWGYKACPYCNPPTSVSD